ncbi:MAG: hypothetical protein JW936_08565 [Sedimentisphaerales bacterium]|nr:hypothetical protein [Sedimentisphaerales bacterium]
MKKIILLGAAVLLGSVYLLYAWTALVVEDDELLRMPGTQPVQAVVLEAPNRCLNCHLDPAKDVTIGSDWMGSMMAQAARDPIFYACLTVALQDSVWALGNPNAGDLCLRCHFPGGWLAGRSDPTNATLMTAEDFDGLHCDFCHQMYDPFHEGTYAGTREGDDWVNYWDEAGNTDPVNNPTLAQNEATTTYLADQTLAAALRTFSGDPFYNKFNLPIYSTYTENASGQYYVADTAAKRAPFADHSARHDVRYSRYHRSRYFCGTCHDVSNPALANLGFSGLPDQSGGVHLISEQYSAFRYFHVERTFSEFMLSDYAAQGGAATNPEFAALTQINSVAACQDCHMRGRVGLGCNKNGTPIRPTQSTEHPHSGVPFHDMTGGNAWISHILASLDPTGPVYDATNAALMSQGPAVLTLDLTAGESPTGRGAELAYGASRALDQLSVAATFKNLSYDPYSGVVEFEVQNNTPHKLISGFPEGRRMFVNVRLYAGGELVYEVNPYDSTVGTLRGLPHSASSPALADNEAYVDELVYEVHPSSTLTGEDHTFHFVLATGRSKDNRIPPRGFDVAAAVDRLSEPVWHGESAPEYFTAVEYAGGYDAVELSCTTGADHVEVSLYYQGTSREYIEFLRDEINGVGGTLPSPTPSGEPEAYIIQTDPFFAQLRAWGDTMWQLWYHNHGLDGSGASVPGIVPFEMTSADLDVTVTRIPGDVHFDGKVDIVDFAVFAWQWLNEPCDESNYNCYGSNLDETANRVDLNDFAVLAAHWMDSALP